MLHPSTKKLIDRLAEMTELGKLDWTEGENDSLIYSTEGYSVCLPDGTNEIVIQSIEGKELERASSEALAATMTESGTAYTQIVASMTAEAARYARGTETAITSLLAGMDDDEPETITEEPGLGDEGPEDPGDEVAAMESEGIANHQVPSAPEVEPEPEADAADPVEATNELEVEVPEEDSNDLSEPVVEAALEVETETDSEPDTESDLTEAVARLADEVNNRDQAEPAEIEESTLGAAAATAMGAVATAAGLDQAESTESDAQDISPEATHAEAEDISSAPTADVSTGSGYVPFGLEDGDDEVAPIAADTAPEDIAAVAPAEETYDDAPVETESEPVADLSAETETPVTEEAEPEQESELQEPELTVEDDSKSNVIAMSAVAVETEETDEPDLEASTASEDQAEPEAEPAVIMTPVEAADDPEPTSEHEPEPAIATKPEAQTYSLSGIGAGFGLGALSAKTEASGIPGPSAVAAAEPEKIVIDATDDVLPEIEGNLNLPPVQPASEISFGHAESDDAASSDESVDDADGDILKPRTRFNPWD